MTEVGCQLNLVFAWCWITLGLLAGVVQGMGFHEDGWLGGYASWRRRLTRLGHIAFLGTGLINLGFALTGMAMGFGVEAARWPGVLLMVGALTMPPVCYLSAWRKGCRRLFSVPVLSLAGGCVWVSVMVVRRVLIQGGV